MSVVVSFSEHVQRCLKASGYSQKSLADALALHPKVLSRKLHGTDNAYLSRLEIRRIILCLADWHAINTREEVLRLLDLVGIEATFFSEAEWQKTPLVELSLPPARSISRSGLSSPIVLHNLPAPTTRLIGREWAVTRLKQLMERDDV